MSGHSAHGLTIVISPLQSLMKDQVDNLDRGITDAVTINGLDPILGTINTKSTKMEKLPSLYIALEMLRSKTIEKILMVRYCSKICDR